jgi:hypothetical protein
MPNVVMRNVVVLIVVASFTWGVDWKIAASASAAAAAAWGQTIIYDQCVQRRRRKNSGKTFKQNKYWNQGILTEREGSVRLTSSLR